MTPSSLNSFFSVSRLALKRAWYFRNEQFYFCGIYLACASQPIMFQYLLSGPVPLYIIALKRSTTKGKRCAV